MRHRRWASGLSVDRFHRRVAPSRVASMMMKPAPGRRDLDADSCHPVRAQQASEGNALCDTHPRASTASEHASTATPRHMEVEVKRGVPVVAKTLADPSIALHIAARLGLGRPQTQRPLS